MTIREVIENITEIQTQNWANNLDNDEIEYIEDNFGLLWLKLKSINDTSIAQPLLEISKLLSLKEMKDGRLTVKSRAIKFRIFYPICIDLIPKKKYKCINPRKIKRKEYDYDFLIRFAEYLKESVANCKDYYDIYEELGVLEEEKVKIFNTYGIKYEPQSSDKIEIVDINSINLHPEINIDNSKSKEYLILLEKIKSFGLLEPIIVDKKTDNIVSGYMRYQCCKELGDRRIQVIKKVFKSDILEIINFQLDSSTVLSEQVKRYRELKEEIQNLKPKEKKALMKGLSLRDYLFKETGISQKQEYKLQYIEKTDSEIHKKVLGGVISITKGYSLLKKPKGIT